MLTPRMTYLGDLTESLPGRVMGPDTGGGYLHCVKAEYDASQDCTRAWFEPALGTVVPQGEDLIYCAHPALERQSGLTPGTFYCTRCGTEGSE